MNVTNSAKIYQFEVQLLLRTIYEIYKLLFITANSILAILDYKTKFIALKI